MLLLNSLKIVNFSLPNPINTKNIYDNDTKNIYPNLVKGYNVPLFISVCSLPPFPEPLLQVAKILIHLLEIQIL